MAKPELLAFINRIEVLLNRKIHDTLLFHIALTHRSYSNEQSESQLESNERLEFLGDAVLGLLVGELLMKKFPESQEGDLSKLRSLVVNEKSLAALARGIELGKFLYLGKGEAFTSGNDKDSILADAYEAVIDAIYLTVGLEDTRTFITNHFSPLMDDAYQEPKDYKTILQETTQKKLKTSPRYVVVSTSGPDHEKVFEIQVHLNGQTYGKGQGRNKKEAEQNAAKETLQFLMKDITA